MTTNHSISNTAAAALLAGIASSLAPCSSAGTDKAAADRSLA